MHTVTTDCGPQDYCLPMLEDDLRSVAGVTGLSEGLAEVGLGVCRSEHNGPEIGSSFPCLTFKTLGFEDLQ